MFHIDSENKLAYLDSLNVKVFPSGRRKSELLNENDQKEKYHIPIDPEARLNTEANHRKHSGLNGYKQNYILSWTNESISLVLAGYLFNIKLSSAFMPTIGNNKNSDQLIGEHLAANLKDNNDKALVADKIYVNILTTDITFFQSVDGTNNPNSTVSTEILRDQSFSADPLACLDLKKDTTKASPMAMDFYFSGLSFSAEPLEEIKKQIPANMHSLSLLILTKAADGWHICESSKLPKIDHGDTKDSVKIQGDLAVEGDINVNGTVTTDEVIIGGMKAITLEVAEVSENKWQLRFNNARLSPLE